MDPARVKGVPGVPHTLHQLEPPLAADGGGGGGGGWGGGGECKGKRALPEPKRAAAVDVFSLLTYRDLSPGSGAGAGPGGGGACRAAVTWDDADRQPRKKPPAAAAAGSGGGAGGDGVGADGSRAPGLLDWAPNRAARFVPYGGLCQERGCSVNSIVALAAISSRKSGTMAPGGAARRGDGRPSVGGARSGGGGRKQ